MQAKNRNNLFSQARLVGKVCDFVRDNSAEKLTLQAIAQKMRMSPWHLHRTFRSVTGIMLKHYVEASKLERTKLLLRAGESVRRSVFAAGHNSTSWLYSSPMQKVGMYSSKYKSGGEGLEIYFSIVRCSLGRLLVAGTNRGVCSVCLGESDSELEKSLQAKYPSAHITKEVDKSSRIRSWLGTILEYLDGERVVELKNLPLDIKATSFQLRVWRELQNIPYGETRSYWEIARRVSCSKGSRAVGNICGENPGALIVPCHRVIRKDGELGGYRWGARMKESLLERERAKSKDS